MSSGNILCIRAADSGVIYVHLQTTKGWHWLNRVGAEPLQSHPRLFQLGWLLVGKWTSKSFTDALRDVLGTHMSLQHRIPFNSVFVPSCHFSVWEETAP